MSVVQVSGLYKYYGQGDSLVRAIDGVSFHVERGEFIAIVGMSGSGKSTLLHLLGGLDSPTRGKIVINDTDLSNRKEEDLIIFRRKNIGFIFQDYNLIPVLNVYENIVLPLEFDKREVDESYFAEIIRFLGIGDKLYEMPGKLSGGQQQRVAIARALITKPQIVLADEPTGNLDSRTSGDVMALLQKTGKEFGQTIILITHNNAIADLADRIMEIRDGKIVNRRR